MSLHSDLLKKLTFISDLMISLGYGRRLNECDECDDSNEFELFNYTMVDIFDPVSKSSALRYACNVLGINVKQLPAYSFSDRHHGRIYLDEDEIEDKTVVVFNRFNSYASKDYLITLYFYVYFLQFIYKNDLYVVIKFFDSEEKQSHDRDVNFVLVCPLDFENKAPRPDSWISVTAKSVLGLNVKEMDWDNLKEVFKDSYEEFPVGEKKEEETPKNNYQDKESYGKYSGSYAQDVAGYSDNVIDDAFDGDPDAYWNID